MPFTATKPFVASKLFHKAGEGSGGGEAVITSLSVTPTTSAQTITAPSGTDGYSPVNVEAVTSAIDANIAAGNIKDGVSILGVTGNYQGQTPTGTMYIISNGTYNVSDKAIANVQVPTTAPDYYILKTKDANNVLQSSPTLINLSGITDIGDFALADTYRGQSSLTSVDLSGLTKITGQFALYNTFRSTGITSIDLSNIQEINNNYAASSICYGCTNLTNVNLSSLEKISGDFAAQYAFRDCTSLTTLNLPALEEIYGVETAEYLCYGCTNLTSVNLSSLRKISGWYAMAYAFYGSGLTGEVDLSSLEEFSDSPSSSSGNSGGSLAYAFQNCTGITSVDLSGIKTFGAYWYGYSPLYHTFQGCTGLVSVDLGNLGYCYPSLPNTFDGCSSLTTVNLSSLYAIYSDMQYTFQNCTSLTSLDLSSLSLLTNYNNGMRYMCKGCTSLASVNLSRLALIWGSNAFSQAFANTALTSLSFNNLAYGTNAIKTNAFNNMLQGVTGCTVHFPANWQTTMSSWVDVTNGFGGTNTTVLFDLPAVTNLDLSKITETGFVVIQLGPAAANLQGITSINLSGLVNVNEGGLKSWCSSMSTLTSIDVRNLESVVYDGVRGKDGLYQTFQRTGLVTVTFNKLKTVEGTNAFYNTFAYCSSLTDVYFPAIQVGNTSPRNIFHEMLTGTSGVTVHFPSNYAPDVSAAQLAIDMSGTNTTVLKDLPATA